MMTKNCETARGTVVAYASYTKNASEYVRRMYGEIASTYPVNGQSIRLERLAGKYTKQESTNRKRKKKETEKRSYKFE